MNIFTKMRKSLLVAAAFLCAGGAWAQDYSPVWTNDFEDADAFKNGYASGNAGRYEILQSAGYKDGSNALEFSYINVSNNNGTTNSFTPPAALSSALTSYQSEYQLDFYFKNNAANNQDGSGIIVRFSGGAIVSILAPKGSDAAISINDVATGVTLPNKTWCHIYINVKDSKTTLSIASVDGTTSYIEDAVIAENADVITKIENVTKRYWGEVFFDDMTLSAPGAKEDITDPSASITAVDGVKRIVTIVPGKGAASGNVGTTYYTTDSSDPSSTNGTLYENPIEISSTTTLKFISYLSDGTASNIGILEVEAGTEISLSEEIINVVGFAENGDVFNPIVNYVYNKDEVFLSPEVELSVTFNGNEVELPYTITENGTIEATVSAAGYASASESYTLQAAYIKTRSVDFTSTDTTNVVELLGDNWTVTVDATTGYCVNNRWGNWEKNDALYKYYNATSNSNNLTDFLATEDKGRALLIGYGVGQNMVKTGQQIATKYWISNASENEVAIYEVNEAQRYVTSNLVTYGVVYTDDADLSHTVYDAKVIAKVSVYSPVRELVVTDGVGLNATGTYTSATFEREFKTAYTYGTICLPFAPDAETCAKYNFYKLASDNQSTETLVFEEETEPKANVAYLYSPVDKAEAIHTFTGGATTISTVSPVVGGDWQFVGTFEKLTEFDYTSAYYFAYLPNKNDGKDMLSRVSSGLQVNPYRAYFIYAPQVATGSIAPLATMRIVVRGAGDNGDGTTGIEEVITPDQIEGAAPAIYNLMGQPVAQPVKGQIYIINGKKVVY